MINPVSDEDFTTNVYPVLRKIFAKSSPFYPNPFSESISEKRILFDWNYKYIVAPPLLSAIVDAAKAVGDSGFYFHGHAKNLIWYIPFSKIEIYTQQEAGTLISRAACFEQTLFSPNAHWGIMTSHETHMLLGSSTKFMDYFKRLVPNVEEQVFQFLEYWKELKDNNNVSTHQWLPPLMSQVYGEEIGADMLQKAGLP